MFNRSLMLKLLSAVIVFGAWEIAGHIPVSYAFPTFFESMAALWTLAVGAHIPITKHLTFSAAYERPISRHRGIFKNRMTSNLTLEF